MHRFHSDYHTHSTYSSDGKEKPERMIRKAINVGLDEIALTDHVDLGYPDSELFFKIDMSAYIKDLERLREKFAGRIRVVKGLELGLKPDMKGQIEDFISGHELDFIIGSTHCVGDMELSRAGLFAGFRTVPEAYQRYLEELLANVQTFDCYSVVGHIDFVERYFPAELLAENESKILKYEMFREIIDEVLKIVISKNKGIEINTSGYRYRLSKPHPSFDIVRRYKELGGEIITIGSDSHESRSICSDFETIYTFLKEIGFNYIASFDKLKPTFIKI